MNWFSFLFQPYARSSCVQIYEHEKLMQKIKVKIKTNEKECLWKNTCLLKVILTITKKASVQCNVNFICSVEQWMTGYGGWFTLLILLVDELFVVHDDSHSSTFRAMRNYTHFTTSRSRLQSIAQQFPIAFLLCISLTARACFFLFFSFSFQQKQQQKQWQQYSAFLWTNYNILCVCMPCHAYSYMLAKRMKGIGLELVYSWIWTLLFSPCMKLCVCFFSSITDNVSFFTLQVICHLFWIIDILLILCSLLCYAMLCYVLFDDHHLQLFCCFANNFWFATLFSSIFASFILYCLFYSGEYLN